MKKREYESILGIHFILILLSIVPLTSSFDFTYSGVDQYMWPVLTCGLITSSVVLKINNVFGISKPVHIKNHIGAIAIFAIVLVACLIEPMHKRGRIFLFQEDLNFLGIVVSLGAILGITINLIVRIVYYKWIFKNERL